MTGRGRERGATAIEMAIILPLLVMLLFGTIDMGRVIDHEQAIRHGSREGARAAAVGNYGGDNSCSAEAMAAGATGEVVCLAKDRTGLDDDEMRVRVLLGTGGYARGEPVAVCIQKRLTSATGIYGFILDQRVVHSKTQMLIEDDSAAALTTGGESAFPGEDWSKCTIS